MITKKELLAVCMELFDRVDEIEGRLTKVEKVLKKKGGAKRTPGRPRKES